MLDGEKILVTGASGKVAFPIARALAARNEVWGVARFSNPADREKLSDVGIRPLRFDVSCDDVAALPDDFTYVFHAAMDSGRGEWFDAFNTNALATGNLLHHCRTAEGFVFCSTGSIYQYQGQHPYRETDPPGVHLRGNYSISKVAAEAVCSWISSYVDVPVTIIRIFSTYGPEGGAPCDRFEAMLAGKPIRLHPNKPNNYNPVYEDDYVELGIRALEAARVPALIVNWASSETVSAEDYCTYMGELAGIDPVFEYVDDGPAPLWADVTYMHEVLGRTKVHWRDGFRRMLEARYPDVTLSDATS